MPTPTAMLVQTTSGLKDAGCQDSFFSECPKEVSHFFKGNRSLMGFTTQYAVNRELGMVVELTKKGKVAQKDVRPLIELGFDEWTYSWAWAPEHFRLENGEIVKVAETVDCSPVETTREAVRWARAGLV